MNPHPEKENTSWTKAPFFGFPFSFRKSESGCTSVFFYNRYIYIYTLDDSIRFLYQLMVKMIGLARNPNHRAPNHQLTKPFVDKESFNQPESSGGSTVRWLPSPGVVVFTLGDAKGGPGSLGEVAGCRWYPPGNGYISHLGKRNIIFKMPFLEDMLVPCIDIR